MHRGSRSSGCKQRGHMNLCLVWCFASLPLGGRQATLRAGAASLVLTLIEYSNNLTPGSHLQSVTTTLLPQQHIWFSTHSALLLLRAQRWTLCIACFLLAGLALQDDLLFPSLSPIFCLLASPYIFQPPWARPSARLGTVII